MTLRVNQPISLCDIHVVLKLARAILLHWESILGEKSAGFERGVFTTPEGGNACFLVEDGY